MALTDFETILGKEVITGDAFVLGTVADIRCEDLKWRIVGIKVKSKGGTAKSLNIGNGKSNLLVQTGDYCINDVILMPQDIDSARQIISPDSDTFRSVGDMIGSKILSKEQVLIGTLDQVDLDLDTWSVVSLKVKLNKEAYMPLGIKKGLLAKRVSGILASDIDNVEQGQITLSLTLDALKGQITVD